MWPALVDRQTGFLNFTPELARAMREMRLAVIGAGGNGAVLDRLVRLGFTRFTIVDPDTVEASNLNRLPFSTAHIGRAKVDAWREHITGVNPDCSVDTHQVTVKRDHGPWLGELLAGADLVFAGATDIEANIVTGRVCADLRKRMIVGPASSGAWVTSTFVHDGEITLERVAGLGPEGLALPDIDYRAAEEKFRALTYYPGRAGKYAPGIPEAVARGELPARSCGIFVSLTNAAMAFEAVKNTAELRGLPLRGARVTAMPVFHVFDPYSGCAYYYHVLDNKIGIPDWLTGDISWRPYQGEKEGAA
ncbi:MAG: ThiF family adenylyltransferase [Desulfovibrionaceae bacterium]|nr:ThiF family adenylyltransferase [Desulfovibrionaceae bacterium]